MNRKKVSGLFLLLVCVPLLAQNEPLSIPVGPIVTSPQVSQMIRYDNPTGVSNTGSVNVQISLLDLDDPDFPFDLSVTYAMDGFKPMSPDNLVGMGWRLNCGGVIMREIHGIPDDYQSIQTNHLPMSAPSVSVRGYTGFPGASQNYIDSISRIISYRDSLGLKRLIREAGYGDAGEHMGAAFVSNNMDASPDVYYFSFLGHSGKFIVGLDGNPVVVSDNGGIYKVDMSDFVMRSNPDYDVESTISIITDDGYRYTFGGNYDSMEYMALSWRDITGVSANLNDTTYNYSNYEALRRYRSNYHNRVVAYHLSRVVAPNGRVMSFEYDKSIPSSLHSHPEDLLLSPSEYDAKMDSISLCYCISPMMTAESNPCPLDAAVITYQLNKIALLRRIYTDRDEVDFSYSEAGCPFFCLPRQQISPYRLIRHMGARLDSLSWRNKMSNHHETAILEYYSSSLSHQRTLLKNIRNPRQGVFHLQYYPSIKGFSSSITIDVDKWGFWSGYGYNQSFTQLIDYASPFLINKMEFTRITDDRNREPSGEDYNAFLLKSVSFPTGGSVEYLYEPHDYSEYFDWSPNTAYSQSYRHTSSRAVIAGGARVKLVRWVDGENPRSNKIRYYRYMSNDLSRSSGYLMSMGDNYLQGYLCNDLHGNYDVCPSGEFYRMNNPISRGAHIRYSLIREYKIDDNEPLETFSPDSIHRFSFHDLSDELSGAIPVTIGGHDGDENESTWHFHGWNSSFTIVDNSGNPVYTYSFSNQDNDVILYPHQQFSEGRYRILYNVPPCDLLNITLKYPYANSLDQMLAGCPYKETIYHVPTVEVARNAFWLSYLSESYFANITDSSPFAKSQRIAQNKYHFSSAIDNSPESGRVETITWGDGYGNEVLKEQFTYERQNVGTGWYFQCHPFVPESPFLNYANIVQIPLYRYLLVGETKTEMGSNDQLGRIITTLTEYDGNGYVESVHQATGGNQERTISYTRVKDEEGTVYDDLQEANILRPITKEYWTVGDDQIYARENRYSLSGAMNNIPLISQILESKNNNSPSIRVELLQYDPYDNPTHVVVDGRSTVYLWGYQGRYLVAEIKNATPENVKQVLNINDLSSLSMMSSIPLNFWDGIRAALPESQITTYYYTPGVGMVSCTGPDGLSTRYMYDDRGRLTSVMVQESNGTWSTTQAYEYHLVNDEL